jgi:hypothetical protein
MTTAFILGIVGVAVLIVVLWAWTQLEADGSCQLDCQQGRQCAGQCVHQPCPHPWNCNLGAKQ